MMRHAGHVNLHFPVSGLILFPLCYSHLLFFVVCNVVVFLSQVAQLTNHKMLVDVDSDIIQPSPVLLTSSQQGPPVPSCHVPESGREQHEGLWGEQRLRCP